MSLAFVPAPLRAPAPIGPVRHIEGVRRQVLPYSGITTYRAYLTCGHLWPYDAWSLAWGTPDHVPIGRAVTCRDCASWQMWGGA